MCKPTVWIAPLVILAALLINPRQAAAAQQLILSDAVDVYRLGGAQLDVLEDKGGRLTIAELTSPGYASAFRPLNRQTPNFGMTDAAFWFRFTVNGGAFPHDRWLLVLDQPVVDMAELYVPTRYGSYEVTRAGVAWPLSMREVRTRNIALPLALSRGASIHYLRVWIPGRAQFPLSVMTIETLRQKEEREYAWLSVCGGFLFAMTLVGAALLALLKERSYLYFVLYILSTLMTVLTLNGAYYAWLLPEYPAAHRATLLISASLMILTGLLFTRSFLKVDEVAPLLDRCLCWMIGLAGLLAVSHLLLPPLYAKIALNTVLMLGTVLSLAAALFCYRRGYAPARYFLFSRVLVYLGFLVYSLINFDLLPNRLMPENSFYIVSMLDAAFITLALVDRLSTQRSRITGLVEDLQREIGERSAAHRSLQEAMAVRLHLEQEIVQVSDDERFKISRELHDGLCQQLTGARLLCSALDSRLAGRQGHDTLLLPLERLLDETVEQAYRLSRGAWPIDHEPEGSASALEELVCRMSQQSGIPIAFRDRRVCPVCNNPRMTQLYRIAQEALVNAVRHARCSNITITLDCSRDDTAILEVLDDGIGPEAGKPSGPGGMGIRIMAHRARTVGGSLEVSKRAEGGTAVVCRVPCMPEERKGADHV